MAAIALSTTSSADAFRAASNTKKSISGHMTRHADSIPD